jgi:hypothetical protein
VTGFRVNARGQTCAVASWEYGCSLCEPYHRAIETLD